MSGHNETKDRTPREGGWNGSAGGIGKSGKAKTLITPLVRGKGEPEKRYWVEKGLTSKSRSPYTYLLQKTSRPIWRSLRNNWNMFRVSNLGMISPNFTTAWGVVNTSLTWAKLIDNCPLQLCCNSKDLANLTRNDVIMDKPLLDPLGHHQRCSSWCRT